MGCGLFYYIAEEGDPLLACAHNNNNNNDKKKKKKKKKHDHYLFYPLHQPRAYHPHSLVGSFFFNAGEGWSLCTSEALSCIVITPWLLFAVLDATIQSYFTANSRPKPACPPIQSSQRHLPRLRNLCQERIKIRQPPELSTMLPIHSPSRKQFRNNNSSHHQLHQLRSPNFLRPPQRIRSR